MKSTHKDNSKAFTNLPGGEFSLAQRIPIEIIVLATLFLILYAPTFKSLVQMWWGSDDYRHGFLVPIISLYLVWMKREQLAKLPVVPSLWLGIPLVLLGGFMLIIGKLGGIVILEELSILVMISGLVSLLLGNAHLRSLSLPILYLLFMVKIFGDGVNDRFHWPFQLVTADIGVWLLQLLGYSVYQDSTYIQLPNMTLEVAAACSGVRFLVSIIAVGIPLAHLTQRTLSRKIGLVTLAVVIAILANGVRVALIGVWAYNNNNVDIHGPFHVLYGIFVSWVGFIVLFVGAWFLGKGPKEKPDPLLLRNPVEASSSHLMEHGIESIGKRQNVPSHIPIFAGTLLLCVIGGYYYFHSISPLPLQQDFRAFPMIIGNWHGEDVDLRTESFRVDEPDEEMLRVYRDPAGRSVTLYVGYFNNQEQGKELVSYKTSWKFHRGETIIEIPSTTGQVSKVNQVVLKDQKGSRSLLFWYDLNGRIVADRYQAKLWAIWDALIHGRTNGALVAISASLGEPEPSENLLNVERRFFMDTLSPMHSFLSQSQDRGL